MNNVKVNMALEHQWEDEESLNTYLSQQLTDRCLALVIGAGISVPFGLPDWDQLIERLFRAKDSEPPTGMRPEQQAEVFRRRYFNSNKDAYFNAVREALYEGLELGFERLRQNGTLTAIGSLVMASCRGSVANVITLNLDNLLELFLSYHGFAVNSISNERHWALGSDVTIYHPHGYLPAEIQSERSNSIILDQESYSRIVGDANNICYQEMLTILRTHTCLFIGLSGDDQNLDSLMIRSKDNHASNQDQTLYWGVRFTTDDNIDRSELWKGRGIFTHIVSDYENHLPSFLFEICQKAAVKRYARSSD